MKNLFQHRLSPKLRWLMLFSLLSVVSFYGAKHATIRVKAYAQVRTTPFVLETASYSFDKNPQGELFYKGLTARRSDGSTASVSRIGPIWGASARSVTFLSGAQIHVFDLIATKTSVKIRSADLAALKERLLNPPANCIYRPDAKLIGNENLFGQEAVVIQVVEQDRRTTRWLAPHLGCESLQFRFETRQPDGSYKLMTDERLLSLKLEEPDPALFDPAANYEETMPSEVQRRHFEKIGKPEPIEMQRKGEELDKRYAQQHKDAP